MENQGKVSRFREPPDIRAFDITDERPSYLLDQGYFRDSPSSQSRYAPLASGELQCPVGVY